MKNVFQTGSDLPVTRRFGSAYCVPELRASAVPRPGGRERQAGVLRRDVREDGEGRDAVGRVVERGHVAARVNGTLDVGENGRPVVVPALLVPAHELEPHRRSGEL